MKNKNGQQINPEIQREREEKRKSEMLYDDENDYFSATLFPNSFMGYASSATESTGLIQVIPESETELEAYDELYSYRQAKPVVNRKHSNA